MYHPSRVWTVAKPVRNVSKPQIRNPKPVKGAVHFTRTQDMRLSPIAVLSSGGFETRLYVASGRAERRSPSAFSLSPKNGGKGVEGTDGNRLRIGRSGLGPDTHMILFPICNVSYT